MGPKYKKEAIDDSDELLRMTQGDDFIRHQTERQVWLDQLESGTNEHKLPGADVKASSADDTKSGNGDASSSSPIANGESKEEADGGAPKKRAPRKHSGAKQVKVKEPAKRSYG